jgi:hypothetical protein
MADQTLLLLRQAVEDLQHQLLAYDALAQLLVERDDGLAHLLRSVTFRMNAACGAVNEAAKALASRA